MYQVHNNNVLLHIVNDIVLHVNTIPLPFSFCFSRASVNLFSLLFDFSSSSVSYIVVKSSEQFGISGRIHGGNHSRISHSLEGITEEITQGYRTVWNLLKDIAAC